MPRRIRKSGEVLNLTNAKYQERITRQHLPEEKPFAQKSKGKAPKGNPAKAKSNQA